MFIDLVARTMRWSGATAVPINSSLEAAPIIKGKLLCFDDVLGLRKDWRGSRDGHFIRLAVIVLFKE